MLRRLQWTHLAGALLSSLFLACGGRSSEQSPASTPDIHVAGYQNNGSANVAMYWKNGIPQALTDGTRDAKAFSVVVSDGDVYVAGGQIGTNGVGMAVYWKNGVPVPLSDGSTLALAESICVSGSDIYAAGYQAIQLTFPGAPPGAYGDVATYWKNGVAVPLTDGSIAGEATSIAVAGNDVYVVGWTEDTIEFAPNSYLTGPVAKLWKNGVLTPLSELATSYAVAESVVVSGSDVYVAGYGAPTMSGAGSEPWIAQYWKNGTAIPLTNGTAGAKAFAVKVGGGSVYAAGFSSAGAGDMATVWNNGSPSAWTTGNSTAVICAMAVTSSRLLAINEYAAGFENSTAKVWVNGMPQSLTDGSHEAEARGIFVVP